MLSRERAHKSPGSQAPSQPWLQARSSPPSPPLRSNPEHTQLSLLLQRTCELALRGTGSPYGNCVADFAFSNKAGKAVGGEDASDVESPP
eukprot:CAMPEP_0175970892 /NCGR_PEP_ID=MMETSP0108-20121206/41332_1 /TAXON_ID=195067 ORGANISM="Goniomonas pacifica, Strain CCMP1869" /NCGR_SAMPLE_ID=MMETSP0108 /ASSEMBLY_ACC=CAM_ASM_000204 /LENGTH=89 /DNA_ID=CAMNT_0017299961 /DNA_START=51 /DNA_END=317 /DNA_ORIENTATION=+